MYKIDKLILNNFKFFYDKVEINFARKHILLYGENGSGKSSIYWALYTFFQSVFKDNTEIRKYFDPKHPENLINRYSIEPSNSGIILELKDNNDDVQVREISINQITTKSDAFIRELTLGSEFINHYALSRIYAYYHKKKINLFGFFEYELLDFITLKNILVKQGEKEGDSNAEVWWNYIETEVPKIDEVNIIETYLRDFNEGLETYLNDITELTNTNITSRFKEQFNIFFEYRPASYPLPTDGEELQLGLTVEKPEIIMTVKMLTDKIADDDKKIIDSPQSFLNEAKLSTIALALRLAILDEKFVAAYPKVLILDDMLMSMDMSNREFILNIILENYQNDYQILFFTHQRGLFEDAKKTIQQYYIKKAKDAGENNPEIQGVQWIKFWQAMEMYEGENQNGIPIPKVIASSSSLQKAIYYFKENVDYSACGNNLRGALEEFFLDFIPSKFQLHGNMIAGLLVSARSYFNYVGFDTNPLDKLERYRERSLNPSSHYNPKTDYFKKELEEIFILLEELKGNKINPLVAKSTPIIFDITTKSGKLYSYTAVLLDDICLYTRNNSSTKYFVDADKRGYVLQQCIENGKIVNLNGINTGGTLKELYYETCDGLIKHKKQKPFVKSNVYAVFKNEAGITLEQLRMQ